MFNPNFESASIF